MLIAHCSLLFMPIIFSKYKTVTIFVCLCVGSLALSLLTIGSAHTTGHASDSLKHRLSVFLAPVNFCSSVLSAISARVAYVGSIFTSVYRKPAEKAELQRLRSEVASLKHQLNAERDRSKRLGELYEFYTDVWEGPNPSHTTTPTATDSGSARTFRLVPANVIAVEPTDWFRYLTIDKGRKHGVDVDMAVITRSYSVKAQLQSLRSEVENLERQLYIDTPHLTGAVVGRIAEVQSRSASVQLITDRSSVVAVTIESLGDLVLLRGQPETEDCAIDEIPSTTHDILKKGDDVIVDERSSVFPPRMLVGNISSIEKGIHFCRIEVQPAFKFSKLREVMVVILDTGY